MINYVSQASGLGADGSPDGALLQAMAARKKAQLQGLSGGQQLLQKASSSEPIYNKSLGYAKLIAGGLGGFLEGNEQRTQQEKAQALARQGATSAAGIAQSLGLSPDQARQLQGMYMANPEAASAIVKQMTERLFAKPDKPADRYVDERLPDGTLAQRNATTNELAIRQKTDMLSPGAVEQKKDIAKAGRSEQNINVGGGSDAQIFTELKDSAGAARKAAVGLVGLRNARTALQGGGYFGAGADTQLAFSKLASIIGLGNPEKITNTETFKSAIVPQVSAMLASTAGTANLSDADLKFAKAAAAGDINLDEKSISRLLDIMERSSVEALASHQAKLDAVYPDNGKFTRERSLFGVGQPPASASQQQGPPVPADLPEIVAAARAAEQPTAAPPPEAQQPAPPAPSEDGWMDMGGGIRIRERR